MKTEVLMERELMGDIVRQSNLDGFFNIKDFIRIASRWRLKKGLDVVNYDSYMSTQATKEFIEELEKRYGNVIRSKRGRSSEIWFHPYLFIDFAMHVSPEIKADIIEWVYDELIKYRNYSGDSFKKMCGSLYRLWGNKATFPNFIKKVASMIRQECGITDEDAGWEKAPIHILTLRDNIHESISYFSDTIRDVDTVINMGFKLARDMKSIEEAKKFKYRSILEEK